MKDHRWFTIVLCCAALAGCASYRPQPLEQHASLAESVAGLDRTRAGAAPIPADRPLTPAEVSLLAVANSPALKAFRARHGVARAQVVQAGLLPDPLFSTGYDVLLAGPDFANNFTAALSADVSALITLSARRRAAQQAAMDVDAQIVWQEWQTISRAQTLTIDLVEQGRLLESLRDTLALLRHRAATTRHGIKEGTATLQMLAPDISALIVLRTQLDAALLAQQQRWQSLDLLLGLEPDVRPRLAPNISVPAITPSEAASMLAALPRRRPDLIALQLGYASQEARMRAAVLGQFPALTIGPNYTEDTSRTQTVGPAVSVGLPLFNRNRGAIAITRASRTQLQAEYNDRLATAESGARSLLDNLRMEKRQLRAAIAATPEARRLAAGAQTGLNRGLLNELSYVQLVVAKLDQERQVIGLEQLVLDQRTALATLLGAGLPPVKLVPPKSPSLL